MGWFLEKYRDFTFTIGLYDESLRTGEDTAAVCF
jgi:hypothetical protein